MKQDNSSPQSRGIASLAIKHPVGVSMIALAVIVLGLFSLGKLSIDLLPELVYPEIRVRILDPGVPATVMEDKITRQLEEQLAITEDAIQVQSSTSLGTTSVDLSFNYDKDVDLALRDASTRLDRAKRFLPDTIAPPVIFKFDPSQIPVAEYVITSRLRDAQEIRTWADDSLRKWFINLPGVAAAEVGGGLIREIHILPDQHRLAGLGLTLADIETAIIDENRDEPAGRILASGKELPGRITSRFTHLSDLQNIPLSLKNGTQVPLSEVASIIDTHQDERIKVRANGITGIKMSIQKQPTGNTIDVVDQVQQRLVWLKSQNLLPEDIEIIPIADQSLYVRQALSNSASAALSGALLAMAVVYLFLGNLRRTLIIGSAIPIAIMVTFVLMGLGGLTLNIMTLGGLALGVGMLVDNTIVMLENIYRHQLAGEHPIQASQEGAAEVSGAVVASTSTNLAAVLPFIFVSGLTGLLFRELIITISAAIVASLVIAVTLVPALAARVKNKPANRFRRMVDQVIEQLRSGYVSLLKHVFKLRFAVIVLFIGGLGWAVHSVVSQSQIFLPKFDDGRITIRAVGDAGMPIEELDAHVRKLEALFQQDANVDMVYSLTGGSIFGRSQREVSNRASLVIQLKPLAERQSDSNSWIKNAKQSVAALQLVGVRVRIYQRGIRGIRTGGSDDDISLRIQGDDLSQLTLLANKLSEQLKSIEGLSNISHSLEDESSEVQISIDRERASALGLGTEELTTALQIALEGRKLSGFLEGDREYDIILRLPRKDVAQLADLENLLLYPASSERPPLHLGDVTHITIAKTPQTIIRDNQMRVVDISASIEQPSMLPSILESIDRITSAMPLPKGYVVYDNGNREAQRKAERTAQVLLGLALFLVFVVMAVQYEALRNPLVIMLSVPFAITGVVIGLAVTGTLLSMPVWLGVIMLAGIVVNNAIVFVEYIEILRKRGIEKRQAILDAARLRLRPILMTTLTTVVGMLPLAIGFGEGAEMLQPLAISIVAGLSFSMLVSLLLVPVVYDLMHRGQL